MCAAYRREQSEGHQLHSTEAHAQMLILSHDPTSKCKVTGASLFALWKVGDKLSVDRIDPTLGYVEGNMQLMALSLNIAKGTKAKVPFQDTAKLLRKLRTVVHDVYSEVPGEHLRD